MIERRQFFNTLSHDFILASCEEYGFTDYREVIKYHSGPKVPDDFITYIHDYLKWIPTIYPQTGEPFMGLNLQGSTIISIEGAGIAQKIFNGLITLFDNAPELFQLTGQYTLPDRNYEKLFFEKKQIMPALKELEEYAAKVVESNGAFFILHSGI